MNKNKMRALLSSVAMLIVSTLVLSSATYAWFVAGDNASVTGIGASVAASSSIQVSRDGTTWTNALTKADLEGFGTNTFPTNLLAVSTQATSSMAFIKGDLTTAYEFTATGFTPSAADTSGVVKFTFYIKSDSDVGVSLAGTTLTGAAINATYVAVQQGTSNSNAASQTPVLYSLTADNYKPLTGTGTGTDNNPQNYIMDDDEFPGKVASTPKSSAAIDTMPNINLLSETPIQVIVYMWLEGQDSNCFTGTGGTAGTANLALNFTKV